MRLVTTVLFLVLHCGLFGTVIDQSCVMNDNAAFRTFGGLKNLCAFGVKSVSVVLYTSNIPNGEFVDVNKSCNLFDLSKPVFFITHGFIANSRSNNISDLASLMVKKDYTVFLVDWSNSSCYNDPYFLKMAEYPAVVYYVRGIGEHLASFIKSTIDICRVPLSNITLIGHSLGAHISSFAAKDLNKTGYGLVPLLIGADPASPFFEFRGCDSRFCKSDAKRTIAIHTSALGLQKSLGHCDLWFNNGFSQPACGASIIGGVNVKCAHNIAIIYLITMIDDYAYVGVSVSSRGIPIPNVLYDCSSYITNYIVVDSYIFNRHSSINGDYCVFVTPTYPYYTETKLAVKNKMLRI